MYRRLSQWYDRYIVTPKSRYRLTDTFNNISKPINCLIFLDDHYLASAGDDQAVCIWDLRSGNLSQRLDDRADRWGHISAMVPTRTATSGLRFVSGTGRSQIVSFRQSPEKDDFEEVDCIKVFEGGNFVEALAFDTHHSRLAVSSHHGDLSVYDLDDATCTLTKRWTRHIGAIIPRAVHFKEKGEQVAAYSLHNGELAVLDVETRSIVEIISLQTRIGNLDYDPVKNIILLDNMASGFDVYPMGRSAASKRFVVKRRDKYVLMAKFAEDAAAIVTGSDHGLVHIFRFGTTEEIQTLYHGNRLTIIQTITTITTAQGEHIIASASAGDKSSICVWRRPVLKEPTPIPGPPPPNSGTALSQSSLSSQLSSFAYNAAVVVVAIAVWHLFLKLSPQIMDQNLRETAAFISVPGKVIKLPNQPEHFLHPQDSEETKDKHEDIMPPAQSTAWVDSLSQADDSELDAIAAAIESQRSRAKRIDSAQSIATQVSTLTNGPADSVVSEIQAKPSHLIHV